MEDWLYEQMNQVEADHWWFVSRRAIIASVLQRLLGRLNQPARILEAGCGTGGNLRLLARFADQVIGLEPNPEAARYAREKTGFQILALPLETAAASVADSSFDLVALLDVLEHLEDDRQALSILSAKLKPGGRILVTVPAFPCLWSRHDVSHQHRRRYRKDDLTGKLRSAGLVPVYSTYFNFWLFPWIALLRGINRLTGAQSDDAALPSPRINRWLTRIMSSERLLLKRFSLPFGVSILMMAEKPAGPGSTGP